MGKSVVTRIAIGFGVVVLLSVGVMLVGAFSIFRIRGSLGSVVNVSTPSLTQSGNLQSSLLRAQVAIYEYLQTQQLEQLSEIESVYRLQRKYSIESLDELRTVLAQRDEMLSYIDEISEQLTSIYRTSESVIEFHKKELEYSTSAAKKLRAFGDVSDELEGGVIDSGVDKASISGAISAARTQVENTLEKSNHMAVLSAQKMLQSSLADIERSLSSLPQKQSEKIRPLLNQFKQVALGDDGLLKTYFNELSSQKKAMDSRAELEVLVDRANAQISELSKAINSLTSQTEEGAGNAVFNGLVLLSAFTLFVLLAAIAVGTYVIKTIRSPLNQVVLMSLGF